MSTTSTVPTVRAQLVTLFTSALATAGTTGGPVQVAYTWPGAAAESECVFLGRHPDIEGVASGGVRGRSSLATFKAGRKQRDENYTVDFTVWSFHPDLKPDQATSADARGFAIRALCEDVLAADPRIGLGTLIVKAELGEYAADLIPFETGYISYIVQAVEVEARLT